MNRALIVASALALGGCFPTTKIVSVPVAVTCQTPMPVDPVYQVMKPEDGLFVRTQKLLVNDLLKDAYILQLKAWGKGCNVDPVVIDTKLKSNEERFGVAIGTTGANVFIVR